MPDENKTPDLDTLQSVIGPEPGESIADTMRGLVDQMGGEKEFDGPVVNAQGDDTQPADDAGTKADDRPRDEQGRFAAKGDKGEDTQPADAGGDTLKGADDKTTTDDEEDVLDPPHDWSVDEQNRFRGMPKETQKFLLDKIEAAGEGITAKGKYEGLEAVLAPRRDAWARRGLDDVRAVNQVLASWEWVIQNPEAALKWLAKETGYDIDEGDGASANGGGKAAPTSAEDDQYADPEVLGLKKQITALQGELDKIHGRFQIQDTTQAEETQRRNEEQRRNLEAEAVKFRDARDDKGRLLHPYFNDVRYDMGAIIRAHYLKTNQVLDPQDAYDRACYADPVVRAKLTAAEKDAAERAKSKETREHAEAARRAGSSISGTSGSDAKPQLTGNIREDMTRVAQSMGML